MVEDKQVLKRVDENTLIEHKPESSEGRALEWRKDFEPLEIQLSEVRIYSNFTVNAVDADGAFALGKIFNKLPADDTIFKYIKPRVGSSRRVLGKCLDFDDNLYRLVKESEDLDLHKCVKLSEGILVNIRECEEEPQSGESYPNGVYYGSLFWLNESHRELNAFEPQIECRIPTSQMDKLISALTKTPSPKMEVRVELFSYRSEMDKALSESWMRKDLLLEDNSPALITDMYVSSEISNTAKNGGGDSDNKKDPFKKLSRWLLLIAALLLLLLFK